MIESVVGLSIALFASVSLLIAISISVKTTKESSRAPLTNTEKSLIRQYGFNEEDIKMLEIDIKNIKYD